MAIKFNQSKGSAQKEKIESYVYTGKENHRVRLVGDLLPRYLYWVKGENNKNLPLECLAFDRNTETFNNKEVDHVPSIRRITSSSLLGMSILSGLYTGTNISLANSLYFTDATKHVELIEQ